MKNSKIGTNRKLAILGIICFVATAVVFTSAFVGDGETGGKSSE